jgi:hypothetical protein
MLAFLLACYCLPPIALAQSSKPPTSSGEWQRPVFNVPQCNQPPVIDGILNDPCWATAAKAAPFGRISSPPTQQTVALVCADSKYLYIAFRCLDSQPQLIKASETQRNGNTFVDDYVSVDIDSQNTRQGYSTFFVTARGTQNETIEGGSAANITWAGDWRAATHRDAKGWTAEMAIPFSLLRYPRGAHTFGVQFERKMAREPSRTNWPDRPPQSQTHQVEYFGILAGLNPTFYKPQPLYLPYTLLSTGEGSSAKFGMDVKYPINSGLTGVATINPDFGTVEQNVTNINFSYTQQFVSDQRPFFAEGSAFFPYGDIFYSPNIGNIDEGVKVTGKENGTSVGFLAVNEDGKNYQHAATASIVQGFGPLSNLEIDYAGNDQANMASGDVIKAQGQYDWHSGKNLWLTQITHSVSWLGGKPAGDQEYYSAGFHEPGHPSININYQGIAPNFNSELGFEPTLDYRGPIYEVYQSNRFDHSAIQSYFANASWTTFQHESDGSFFMNSFYTSAYVTSHTGNGIYIGLSQGQREQYHDHVNEVEMEWNNNSLYDSGNVDFQRGSQSNELYRWVSVNQGYGLSHQCSIGLSYNWQDLGGAVITQTVVTPTYRLTSERSIGGRLVSQSGQTDIFLSFAQQARSGADIFFILGDPNSATTRGLVQMKIVEPFQ